MDTAKLLDLGFCGSKYTWGAMRRSNEVIQERLGRCLMNDAWQILWPNSMIIHAPQIGSDHCPLILNLTLAFTKRRKMFNFEASWINNQEFRGIVDRCWNEEIDGSNL